ncbi:TraR/DksA family transcriptional regulator [Alphaproteobacteria bacterium LSUCC0684]
MDAIQQQSMNVAREERRQRRLKLIRAALDRLDSDEYGYCLACGEDIPYKRLLADPATTCCVDCSA